MKKNIMIFLVLVLVLGFIAVILNKTDLHLTMSYGDWVICDESDLKEDRIVIKREKNFSCDGFSIADTVNVSW